MWRRTSLFSRTGTAVTASQPLIVSASRRTDIPSHYAAGFRNRLRHGFTRCTSPFGKDYYVSFANARFFVFWTKHMSDAFYDCLDAVERRGAAYYFLYTLNDYEREGLEPNLPSLDRRIKRFHDLSAAIGRHKVVWRFDPLVLTETTGVGELLERIKTVGDSIYRHTEKLVFSFADIEAYRHVKSAFRRQGVRYREWDPGAMIETAREVRNLARSWGIAVAACCEAIDVEGIEAGRCIDDRLIRRIASEDEELLNFLGSRAKLKDPGQRKNCGCIVSADVGRYGTCPTSCLYCYANTGASQARHRPAAGDAGDSIG